MAGWFHHAAERRNLRFAKTGEKTDPSLFASGQDDKSAFHNFKATAAAREELSTPGNRKIARHTVSSVAKQHIPINVKNACFGRKQAK